LPLQRLFNLVRGPNNPSGRVGIGAAIIGLVVLAMVLLWLGGDHTRVALRYERARILDGELWRLLTGHMVHGDFQHLLLNMVGASIVIGLFRQTYGVLEWIVVLVVSVVAIDIGFLLLEPQLTWYVGASGVLYGGLAAGAVAWWRTESKWLALALTAVVLGKFAWEQTQGALPFSGDMTVIVNAHVYGAVGGALTALAIEALHVWRKQSQAPL